MNSPYIERALHYPKILFYYPSFLKNPDNFIFYSFCLAFDIAFTILAARPPQITTIPIIIIVIALPSIIAIPPYHHLTQDRLFYSTLQMRKEPQLKLRL